MICKLYKIWGLSCIFFFILICSVHAATVQNVLTGNNLVGYWSLDEGTSTLTHDFSGNGNTGTLSGSPLPTWIAGKHGKALSFSGSPSYVDVTNSGSYNFGTNSFSLGLWVKYSAPGTVTSYTGIISKKFSSAAGQAWYGLIVFPSNQMVFELRDGTNILDLSAAVNSYPSDGAWHYIIGVVNRTNNTAYIYVDGIQVASRSITTLGSVNNTKDLNFGGNYPGGTNWSGFIDDVRVYNAPLSAAQVYTLYGQGVVTKVLSNNTGLVGSWTFDEGTSTLAHDFSGNGNTGTLISSPTWVNSKHGKALSFSGSNYVDVGTSTFGITTAFTVSGWVYPTTKDMTIFSNARDCCGAYKGFNLFSSNAYANLSFTYFDSISGGPYGISTSTLPLNVWTFVTATFQTGAMKLYENGVLVSSGSPGGTGIVGTPFSSDSLIGRLGVSAAFFSHGLTDDVRLWNRALGSAEVYNLYQGGKTLENAGQNTKNTSGLVGYWSFNGVDTTATTATDVSGNGNIGTFNGGVKKTSGKVGQALSFDGTTGYVSVPVTGTQFAAYPITISFWAQTKVTSSFQTFIKRVLSGATQGYNILIDNSNAVGIRIDDSGSTNHTVYPTSPQINDGRWHFCVVTITSGGLVTVYSDAVSSGSATFSSGFNLTGGDFGIPSANDTGLGTGAFINAGIDEVRMYNRVLSTTEISALYVAGK